MVKILLAVGQGALARMIARKIGDGLGYEVLVVTSRKEAEFIVSGSDGGFSLAIMDSFLPDAPDGEAIDMALARGIPTIALLPPDIEDHARITKKPIADYVFRGSMEDIDYLVSQVKRIMHNGEVKVLIVEDSLTYRVAMKEMLSSQLFMVHEAGDGIEALKVLDENPDIRIVLTDYNMPNMDGYELVGNIRKRYAKDRLSVIVISAAKEQNIASRFLKLGANDYITKPFSVEEFNCRVNINAEHLELIENINNMANRDFLTGLYNRRYLFDAGEVLFSKALAAGKLSVAMLDIDHFKKVNDTYGHEAGDVVIKRLANMLESSARPGDMVARMGGEEFCILMPGITPGEALALLEEIRRKTEEQVVRFKETEIKFTVSGGLASPSGGSLDEALALADTFLYEAKQKGRNRVCAS